MFEQVTTRRPKQIAKAVSLAGSTTGGITAGTEVVIASVQLQDSAAPVLESLYFDGDSSGTGVLVFRVTLDGVQIGDSWALPTKNPMGQAGLPRSIGKNLPPGRKLEVRCQNNGSDSTLNAYSDGEVCYYDRPI